MAIWIVAAIVVTAIGCRLVTVTLMPSARTRDRWVYLVPGLILAVALPALVAIAIWPAAPSGGAAAGLILAAVLVPVTLWLLGRRPHDVPPQSDAYIELAAWRVIRLMIVVVGFILLAAIILVAVTILSH